MNSGIATIAGQVDCTQQLIDQSPVNIDEFIIGDLLADLAFQIDNQVVNGTGTAGQLKGLLNVSGVQSVTYTSAAPKVTSATNADSFYFQLASVFNKVNTARKLPIELWVMASRRWTWVLTALDSQNGRWSSRPTTTRRTPRGCWSGSPPRRSSGR